MSTVIVELGSGNTCRNERVRVKEMLDAVRAEDSGKHRLVMKWQLFQTAPPNRPLEWQTFDYAYQYAKSIGYETTSSVFDQPSLDILMRYEVPFVKIACRPHLYALAKRIPVPVYMSVGEITDVGNWDITPMACVPEYPATLEEYERRFSGPFLQHAVSDHTPGWDLYWKWRPKIIEKHVVLERDRYNPDAGPFAVTVDELAEVIGEK